MEINFKKKFGQNFLTDKNLLKSIVVDSKVDSGDTVVEIGAGAGALTEQLSLSAKRVIAFEIDRELEPILSEKFADSNNVEIIYEDFLNFNEDILLNIIGGDYKVVANLPYYITTPILTKLFLMKRRPKTISVMVQKEVGERICAKVKTKQYGYFSALVRANAEPTIIRNVSRKMFTPAPNVDSCVVMLTMKENAYSGEFFAFLKAAFAMKRKTLLNNLQKSLGLEKDALLNALGEQKIDLNARAEELSVDELNGVFNAIKCKKLI